MLPREHGAYGQLLFPLATGFAVGSASVAGAWFAAAAILIFLAHEPLLVVLGQRGSRAARDHRAQAWRWLLAMSTGAVVCGSLALVAMTGRARLGVAVSSALAVGVGVTVFAARERSATGEALIAVAMSSLALPMALAGGASVQTALTCAVAYAAGFIAATVSVHAVIGFTRKPPSVHQRQVAAAMAVASVAALSILSALGILRSIAPWAALPLCAGASMLAAKPPSASRLRVVGWTLVGASAATAAILVAGLRSA